MLSEAAPAEPGTRVAGDDPPPPIEHDALAIEPPASAPPPAAADGKRSSNLPTVKPDPMPDGVRSRFDVADRVVYYNDRHEDYLLVKDDQTSLLDYLAVLVAKELVVYNNPRSVPDELGEEMVRMLVRVRRHMPRPRRPATR